MSFRASLLELEPAQLESPVQGTYGSILDTMRHLVIGGDSGYLFELTDDPAHRFEDDRMDLRELRAVMDRNEATWSGLLAQDLDPETAVKDTDEGGFVRDAPVGIRLAQALHHGTDHRSQICTALTTLGAEPPGIDVWEFGLETGRVVEFGPAV